MSTTECEAPLAHSQRNPPLNTIEQKKNRKISYSCSEGKCFPKSRQNFVPGKLKNSEHMWAKLAVIKILLPPPDLSTRFTEHQI